jgi:very-short-patch-repair endonuclease
MKHLARKLRQQATDAERILWRYLRAHRMAGYKFQRQVVIEPYIVDFVCLEARLIVEADGGQHLEQVEDDLKRSLFLESLGYKVIRFWNHEILGDIQIVLERIHGYLIKAPSPGGIRDKPESSHNMPRQKQEGKKE